MRRNSGIITADKIRPSQTASGGVHDLHDQFVYYKNSTWQMTHEFLDCVEATTSLTENAWTTVTITTKNFFDGENIYYQVATTSGTTMVDADFSGITVTGSTTITNNTVTLTYKCPGGDGTENNQFKIQVLTHSGGSVATQTDGNPCETAVITLTDAALAQHPNHTDVNSAVSSYSYNDTSDIITAIENLGYKVFMIPTYNGMAESMENTDPVSIGKFLTGCFLPGSTDYITLSAAQSNASLDGKAWWAFCGFQGSTFYGTASMHFTGYTGNTTRLYDLTYPETDRTIYTHVRNADNSTVTNVAAGTSTIISDGMNPNSTYGTYQSGRFAQDDGCIGFRNGTTRLDGNGGPYMSQGASDSYGCENPNAGDSSANDFYWGGVTVSTTYAFYFFTLLDGN
tara:strand:+ start:6125 stop:7318 length:1194 start_codon:yes stop_codon:yes gene_type:complete